MIQHFTVSSPAFENHGLIPARYTCDEADINPELRFHHIPESAKSLAIIMDDPDASGGTFTHWTVWNIDPTITAIKTNHLPKGAIEGMTSFGKKGYGGPCPPPGKPHRYYFKVYALGKMLDLPPSAHVEDLEHEIHNNIIEKADLFLGKYKRESVVY